MLRIFSLKVALVIKNGQYIGLTSMSQSAFYLKQPKSLVKKCMCITFSYRHLLVASLI